MRQPWIIFSLDESISELTQSTITVARPIKHARALDCRRERWRLALLEVVRVIELFWSFVVGARLIATAIVLLLRTAIALLVLLSALLVAMLMATLLLLTALIAALLLVALLLIAVLLTALLMLTALLLPTLLLALLLRTSVLLRLTLRLALRRTLRLAVGRLTIT